MTRNSIQVLTRNITKKKVFQAFQTQILTIISIFVENTRTYFLIVECMSFSQLSNVVVMNLMSLTYIHKYLPVEGTIQKNKHTIEACWFTRKYTSRRASLAQTPTHLHARLSCKQTQFAYSLHQWLESAQWRRLCCKLFCEALGRKMPMLYLHIYNLFVYDPNELYRCICV